MSREKIKSFVENRRFQNFIIGLIIFNSITIGFETSPDIMANYGSTLLLIDKIILSIYVIEILMKFYVYGFSFFKNGWNVFDFMIVAIALIPASGALAVLRALRIFRSLRLIKNIPKLRFIVESLFLSLPSISWIFILLTLTFYIFAVIGTKLFGQEYPQWFGTLGTSMFSLFQIMTLEGWADMAREIMAKHYSAYIYFIAFILISSYTTLNIFIAIIVNTMSEMHLKNEAVRVDKIEDIIQDESEELKESIRILKEQVNKLEERLIKK